MLAIVKVESVNLLDALRSIIATTVNEAKGLSRMRWSGVHEFEDRYRIHEMALIPVTFQQVPHLNTEIQRIVRELYPFGQVEWDPVSLWLTVHKG